MIKLADLWNRNRIVQKFRNMKLTRKMVIVYMIFVFIPGILTAYLMNIKYYDVLWEKYYRNADDVFRTEVETVEIRLNDISKLKAHFTSNSVLMDYMATSNMSVADSVYDYMKYFRTVFQIARSSSPYVTSITVYTRVVHEFEMTGLLENLEEDSVPEDVTKSVYGCWKLTLSGGEIQLTYYEPMYMTGYQKFLGVLKICVDPSLVMNCFTEEHVRLYLEDQDLLIEKEGDRFLLADEAAEQGDSGRNRFTYISEKNMKNMKGQFLAIITMSENFMSSFLVMLLPSLLMLLLFPMIYLGVMNRQMKRIEKLSAYINQNHTATPKPYQESSECSDEIGTLVKVYNHNISEISRLLKEVDLAEMHRKDSEFYALQAQIKPHFLYNTLENIRMTAEQEQDTRTASMLEILGKYMRYGLQKDRKYTLLTSELQHVKYYQQLMDIRFPGEVKLSISAYTDISGVSCPYLLLQPMIENALKHGKNPGELIDISIEIVEASSERQHRDIELLISNNGEKIPEERFTQIQDQLLRGVSDENGHVGLNNVNFRLISCYGRDYYMRIENGAKQGCRFMIYLPAETIG